MPANFTFVAAKRELLSLELKTKVGEAVLHYGSRPQQSNYFFAQLTHDGSFDNS